RAALPGGPGDEPADPADGGQAERDRDRHAARARRAWSRVGQRDADDDVDHLGHADDAVPGDRVLSRRESEHARLAFLSVFINVFINVTRLSAAGLGRAG